MAEKNFHSKHFVKNLLIIESLRDTSSINPKNSKKILDEVKKKWAELFPGIPFEDKNKKKKKKKQETKEKKESPNITILRHVQDMNRSGLYDIRTHKEKQKGYYNATGTAANGKNFIFTLEEFAIIAMSLYKMTSISKEETKQILLKFENLVNTLDESFKEFFKAQIKHCEDSTRKNKKETLPVMLEILKARITRKKIQFKLYDPLYLHNPNSQPRFQKIRTDLKSDEEKSAARDKIYTVSPYHNTWDNDEVYLVAYDPKTDIIENFEIRRRLSHFKISEIANIKILDEDIVPLNEILELETETFSWEKYFIDHINMASDTPQKIQIKIHFKEDFLNNFSKQFGSNKSLESIVAQNKERYFQAVISVPDSEEIYRWLMCYFDKVQVVSPQSVQEKLKQRFQSALENLNAA